MEPHKNNINTIVSSQLSLRKLSSIDSKANGLDDPPQLRTKKISIKNQRLVQQKSNRLDDEYVVIGRLGSGIYGDVFKIKHKQLGLIRALKVIKKDLNKNHSQKQEIEVLKSLDHPNILKIYEFYELPNFYYIVTELFDGKQLYNQILDHGIFSQSKAAEAAHQILKALAYSHQRQIAHRDIKLQNILIKCTNGVITIKVIDWGFGSSVKSKLMRVCGTHQYAAPEIFQGQYDQKCDMWSFGVLLYVLLSGIFPFRGVTKDQTIDLICKGKFSFENEMWENISTEAKSFISSLITKNPEQRLSAKQALNSPWLDKYLNRQLNVKDLKDALTNFKLVHIRNNITGAALNFINNYLSSHQQKERLNHIFNMLDTDGDGVLSFEEISKGYQTVYGEIIGQTIAEQTFAKLDLNHNGILQYSEFITYSLDLKKNLSYQKMTTAFRLFDHDLDGTISLNEMKQTFSYDSVFDQHLFRNWLDDLDQNGDGTVDLNEFTKSLIQICSLVHNKQVQELISQSDNKQTRIHPIQQKQQLPRLRQIQQKQLIKLAELKQQIVEDQTK